MPKTYKLKINHDESLTNVSEIFSLTKEQRDDLMKRFQENIRKAFKENPKFKIGAVFKAAGDAATNDEELAYVFFRVGKEHEQQNMRQAAEFAEKVIIPQLARPGTPDGKLPN